jgi:probable rRNA maturation factor
VVICTEQALEQAENFGHSQERELVYLFVHGVLHLMAYDHETDADRNAMRTIEERILTAMDLSRHAKI